MAFSMNKVFLLGSLGRDPEVKFTPGGKQVANFSIATERSWKPQGSNEWSKETSWHNIVLWSNEKLVAQLAKGSKVMIEGRLNTRSYDNKDGKKTYITEVIADSAILCSGGEYAAAGGSNDSNDYDGSDTPF